MEEFHRIRATTFKASRVIQQDFNKMMATGSEMKRFRIATENLGDAFGSALLPVITPGSKASAKRSNGC